MSRRSARWHSRAGGSRSRCDRPSAPRRRVRDMGVPAGLLACGACEGGHAAAPGWPAAAATATAPAGARPEESGIWMIVGERRFAIPLADNAAARAFAARLPLTLDMSELDGNEKH